MAGTSARDYSWYWRDEPTYRRMLMEMPEPPKACMKCGRELMYLVEPDDAFPYWPSGHQHLVPTWRCPKTVGRLNRLLMLQVLHDEYEPSGTWGTPHWERRQYR